MGHVLLASVSELEMRPVRIQVTIAKRFFRLCRGRIQKHLISFFLQFDDFSFPFLGFLLILPK